MPVQIQQNFNIADFQNIAHAADADQNVVLKRGGFEVAGKVGTFFAGKAASRHAAEALFNAIKLQYGETVADTLAPQFRDSMVKGKPLSARTVQTVLVEAQEYRQALQMANAATARTFIEGNRANGDTRNIDAALAPLFAELGLDDAGQAALKASVLDSLANSAAASGKLLSFQDLKEIGVSMAIAAAQNSYADRLSAQHGLNAGQAAQMRELVQLAGAQARMAAPGRVPLSPGQICLAAERGELPGQQALLFAMGKCDNEDAGVRDAMNLSSNANRVDMALFSESSKNGGGIALSVRVMEKLPEMRQMQPEGPLSRETLWQGCFGERLPVAQAAKSNVDFYSDMLFKLNGSFSALKPGDPYAGFNGMMFHAYGLSTEKCSQAVMGSTGLTMGDFIAEPTFYSLSRLPAMDANAAANEPQPAMAAHAPEDGFADLFAQLDEMAPPRRETIEDQLAKDLHRRGTHNGIEGFSPVISFGVPGQPVQSVDVHDMAGLTEAEQADFRDGKPNPISARLIRHCRELCNGNEMQARVLAMGMTQAGTIYTRTLSPATGAVNSEHAPHHMDARRNEDGSVTLRIYTPENSPLDADYTFTIQPDGQNKLTAFHMRPATDDPAVNIQRDPRFSTLSPDAQQTLVQVLKNATPEEAAILKDDFFGIPREGYDIQRGLDEFRDGLIHGDGGFLNPIQQRNVRENGIHEAFIKDTGRRSINSFTSADGRREEVPRINENAGLRPADLIAFCTDHLVRLLGEEHKAILPFVTMMASQAGLDSALSFLPHLSGATDPASMHLVQAGIVPGGDDHSMNVVRNGDRLILNTEFSQPYRYSEDERDPGRAPELILKGNVSMVIDLAVPPTAHEIDGKVVLVPSFTLENGDVHFESAHI